MTTHALYRGQPGYPAELEDLADPPPRLFVRGPLEGSAPRVAVVGTRRPSEAGRRLAEALGRGLSEAGVVVVSGGALGIDGAAHRGAVRAGRPTWVVLPSPLDAPAPASHRGLFEDVLGAGGAWLSELEAGVGRHAYFRRNRIMAALAHVVVAVEAKVRSGTQHTMQAALHLGRPRGAYPWPAGEPFGAGCLQWLKQGAHLVTGPEDVLALVDAVPGLARRVPVEAATGGAPDHLLAALTEAPLRPEVLAARLGAPLSEVLTQLSLLEITQQVRAWPGGRFSRT